MQKSMYDEHLLSPLENNENKESQNPAAMYSGKSATNSHLSPSISLVKPWLHGCTNPSQCWVLQHSPSSTHQPAAAHQKGTTPLDVSLGLLCAAEAEGAQCRVKEKSHCSDTRGTAGGGRPCNKMDIWGLGSPLESTEICSALSRAFCGRQRSRSQLTVGKTANHLRRHKATPRATKASQGRTTKSSTTCRAQENRAVQLCLSSRAQLKLSPLTTFE